MCEHKVVRIKNSAFDWCKLCGVIVYHMKVGGVESVFGGISCDFSKQRECESLFEHRFERCEGKHDFFKLTLEVDWCEACGMLSSDGIEVFPSVVSF